MSLRQMAAQIQLLELICLCKVAQILSHYLANGERFNYYSPFFTG